MKLYVVTITLLLIVKGRFRLLYSTENYKRKENPNFFFDSYLGNNLKAKSIKNDGVE
jgi:hypothetical protein